MSEKLQHANQSPLRTPIVYIASTDWDGLWFQRQEFARRFALAGHPVYYVNRTLQRFPRLEHFRRRFLDPLKSDRLTIPRPSGLTVVTPILLPPLPAMRVINRVLIRRAFRVIDCSSPVVVADVPTYNTLDMLRCLKPGRVAYLNVHNYDESTRIVPHLLESEKELVHYADILFGDSEFNCRRLKRISGRADVYESPPGVDFDLFRTAYRGDEAMCPKSVYFYGNVQFSVHIELYNKLSERYQVVFIGRVSDEVRDCLSPHVEVRPAVGVNELARQLRQADVLGMFYRGSRYEDGVIPAKLFECIATGKPVVVTGLHETKRFSDAVYNCAGSAQHVEGVIANLSITETAERARARELLARSADWGSRFRQFYKRLIECTTKNQ